VAVAFPPESDSCASVESESVYRAALASVIGADEAMHGASQLEVLRRSFEYVLSAMKRLHRFWRRRQKPLLKPPEGEEYEIEKAEREAQKERDRFAESLIEKAGHARYPFLKDPFE